VTKGVDYGNICFGSIARRVKILGKNKTHLHVIVYTVVTMV